MSGLLPSTPDTSAAEDTEPRVIGVDSDTADDLLAALSSSTARRLLAELHEEPDTPSALADRVDTSLQNAQYHLGKLQDAGAIEVIDTIYSEKGREMKVYAPSDRPLVVVAGNEEETTNLRSALTGLLGGTALLAIASLIVQVLTGDGFPLAPQAGGAGGAGAGGPAAAPTPTPGAGGGGISAMDVEQTQVAEAARTSAEGLLATLPPGVLFFAGGVTVLLAGFAVWYVRSYRR